MCSLGALTRAARSRKFLYAPSSCKRPKIMFLLCILHRFCRRAPAANAIRQAHVDIEVQGFATGIVRISQVPRYDASPRLKTELFYGSFQVFAFIQQVEHTKFCSRTSRSQMLLRLVRMYCGTADTARRASRVVLHSPACMLSCIVILWGRRVTLLYMLRASSSQKT